MQTNIYLSWPSSEIRVRYCQTCLIHPIKYTASSRQCSFLLLVFHVCHIVLSLPCRLVVNCPEKADLLAILYIENTRWVSFDIKFTRQGFENACWHREACRAIQHAFSKPSLVNLISKDGNLVFYLSAYPLLNTLQTSDYDVIFDFGVNSASLATSFKKCNVIMTW